MANIKFLVRGSNPDKASAIYVTSRFGRDEKLMYATPLKVEPKYWDEKKQRMKVGKSIPVAKNEEAAVLNSAITAIETMLKTLVADSARNGKAVTKKRSSMCILIRRRLLPKISILSLTTTSTCAILG